MRKFRKLPEISISASVCLYLACVILLLPLKWVIAYIFALLFHEACHYIAIVLCGGSVTELRICGTGIEMETQPMESGKELLCALAGPAGGAVLILLGGWMPEAAVCAIVQTMYNLLPLYPLDGGRALRCTLDLLFSKLTAQRLERTVKYIFLIFISAFAIYISCILRFGLLPVLFAASLILKAKKNSLQTS